MVMQSHCHINASALPAIFATPYEGLDGDWLSNGATHSVSPTRRKSAKSAVCPDTRTAVEVAQRLTEFPERGSHPRELAALGIRDYRQTAFRPYRVIHRVLGSHVVIYLMVDGRRDLQSVLARRLPGG